MFLFERITLKSKIITFAYREFPHFISKMKEIKHSYDNSYEGQKIYHMEDDLWTHTLLVLNQSVSCDESDHIDILAAFCHDFGKMTSGEVREEKKTISFPKHAQRGVQNTVDFLVSFQKEYPLLSDDDIEMIAVLVSKHIEFVNTKLENIFKFCNGNRELVIHASRLAINDNLGRVVREDNVDQVFNVHQKFNIDSISYFDRCKTSNTRSLDKPVVTLYCGCSNIGKDTLASKFGGRIWSLDKERVAIYLENHPDQQSLDSKTLYSLAYQYTLNKDLNLVDKFYQRITNFVKEDENLNICNTLLHRQHRVKIVNYLRNIFKDSIIINCIFLISPSQRILNNAKNNTEKLIPENVLFKFMDYQNTPTMLEGFDNIDIKLLK